MTTCAWAAKLAVQYLDTSSSEWLKLSTQMCWTATFQVAVNAGILTEAQAMRLFKTPSALKNTLSNGKPVRTAAEMREVPAGYLIYFKVGTEPIHAMIAIGDGHAVGNKNDCVGVGSMTGWESLDLAAGLEWSNGDVLVPGRLSRAKRSAAVRTFPITTLAHRARSRFTV